MDQGLGHDIKVYLSGHAAGFLFHHILGRKKMAAPQAPAPVPTTNQGASDAVSDVNTIIEDGLQAGEAAAETAAPVLKIPVLKQLFEGICNALVNWFFKPFIDTFTGKVIIELDEYEALQTAVQAQTALSQAAQSGNLNAQAQAQAVLDAAVAKAAQYVGAIRPAD